MRRRWMLCVVLLFAPASFAQSYVPERKSPSFKVGPVVPIKAYAFDLRDVTLLPGSPFRNAMTRDSSYLLSIEPDRLLHRFRTNAGLPPKGEVYGGWESEGLSGHTLGHYLSACSMMYASTGEPEFKRRVDYIVDELALCQSARKTGYVGAIPNEDSVFARVARGDIHSSGFDLNGAWSPWYTVHKVMAGLVDAYLYAGNTRALKVVRGIADWAARVVNGLSDAQRLNMLNCEYGGMNDVLANLYAITGKRSYLDLANRFRDEFVMGELARRIDPMAGKHSNTNIPKVVGAARLYELTGERSDSVMAAFFWETMVRDHSYVIGGNGNYEYCGAPGKLNDQLSDNTCETCCTYNMLKLTRHLFCWHPTRGLADYYERALYNDILASQNPLDGMMCYFLPLRMGTRKEFSTPFTTFTCCVGSGMENHSKYAEAIYYEASDGGLYLNLFIPSELRWKDKHVTVRQETQFPESDSTTLTIHTKSAVNFPLYIRDPRWAAGEVSVRVNGEPESTTRNADGYLTVSRTWKDNDRIVIVLPMGLHSEAMPDNPNRIALLYGPIVLAGQLGSSMPDPVYGAPVLLTDVRNPAQWVLKVPREPLTFAVNGIAKPMNPLLRPLYETVSQYYTVYFDYFTNAEWERRQKEYLAEKEREREIDERTIDNFRIGEMQPERDHNLKASEQSYVDAALGRKCREARRGNYFSFDMQVRPGAENSLLFTYIGDDKDRMFDILVGQDTLATVLWKGGETGKFYDEEYPIPAKMIGAKTSITVTVTADHGKTAGRIFGVRSVLGRAGSKK